MLNNINFLARRPWQVFYRLSIQLTRLLPKITRLLAKTTRILSLVAMLKGVLYFADMFQKQTLKIASAISIVLCTIGILISVLGAFFIENGDTTAVSFFLGIVSWSLLLWSSVIASKLCMGNYDLYESHYRKVGYCVYAIVITFILFLWVGLVLGIVLSLIIFGTLRSLKRNLDDWMNSHPDFLANEPVENENSTYKNAE